VGPAKKEKGEAILFESRGFNCGSVRPAVCEKDNSYGIKFI
jgi:hypothetical protein